MLKVFIADDEAIIREGIIKHVPWKSIGCEVIGSARDGIETLKMVSESKPDILITDIKMPYYNGLDVISLLKDTLPQLFTIIISGYNDFEYAHRALQLGAYDYILKPINIDYLITVIKSIKQKFFEIEARKLKIEKLSREAEDNRSVQLTKLIWEILFAFANKFDLRRKVDTLALQNTFSISIIIQLDDYFNLVEKASINESLTVQYNFSGSINKCINNFNDIYIIPLSNYECILCLLDKNRDILILNLNEIIYTIRNDLYEQYKYTITIGIGQIYSQVENLSDSYKEALKSISYKFVVGKNIDINYLDIQKYDEKNDAADLIDYYKIAQLNTAIKSCDKYSSRKWLFEIFTEIQNGEVSSYASKLIISTMYFNFMSILLEFGMNPDELFFDYSEQFKLLNSMQTVEEAKQFIIQLINKIIESINDLYSHKTSSLIAKSKKYINENYFNKDLSLDLISTHVKISKCYLSSLFKKETGFSYIDYITNYRISKAKELLTDSTFKTYEICFKVGYDNPTYFSTLFKKYTGVSPTQYRKTIGLEEYN